MGDRSRCHPCRGGDTAERSAGRPGPADCCVAFARESAGVVGQLGEVVRLDVVVLFHPVTQPNAWERGMSEILQVERLFDDGGTPPAIAGRLFEPEQPEAPLVPPAPVVVQCDGQLTF